jgi:hypothetical protein
VADGSFEELLPFDGSQTEAVITDRDTAMIDGGRTEGGSLNIMSEESRERPVYVATATGLLLLVIAAHLRRFLATTDGR